MSDPILFQNLYMRKPFLYPPVFDHDGTVFDKIYNMLSFKLREILTVNLTEDDKKPRSKAGVL